RTNNRRSDSYRKDRKSPRRSLARSGERERAFRFAYSYVRRSRTRFGATGRTLGLEQGGEMLGVGLGVVAVAVVEQHVGLAGVAGQGAHLRCPFGQFGLGVAVAAPFVDILAVPLG